MDFLRDKEGRPLKGGLKIKRTALYCAVFLAAGFLNGLLGAGGGVIVVFSLSLIYGRQNPDREKDIFILSLSSVFLLCVFSSVFYGLRGASSTLRTIDLRLIIPAAAGGLSGGWLLYRINARLLKAVFAVIVIISGIIMAVSR